MPRLRAVTGVRPGTGHGEGFIWQASPHSPIIAIDAGATHSVGRTIGALNPAILVLSHDDHDHIGGAVHLINGCHGSLEELWVPAEWAILVRQIASTSAVELVPAGPQLIELSAIEAHIATRINIARGELQAETDFQELVTEATENLMEWRIAQINPAEMRRMLEQLSSVFRALPWYGATSAEQVFERTLSRSEALLAIFRAALAANIRVRFFSVDLALSSISRYWESEGRPGIATLANAAEAPSAPSITLHPGLATAYALHLLTVQNRRALSTLLWTERATPHRGGIVWSDTDGNWLSHASPRGFEAVVRTATVTSAPHHASANIAHDRVWQELALLPGAAVMICAGGNSAQSYRNDYLALQIRRCCTWCRHTNNPAARDVEASAPSSGAVMTISRQCLGRH